MYLRFAVRGPVPRRSVGRWLLTQLVLPRAYPAAPRVVSEPASGPPYPTHEMRRSKFVPFQRCSWLKAFRVDGFGQRSDCAWPTVMVVGVQLRSSICC